MHERLPVAAAVALHALAAVAFAPFVLESAPAVLVTAAVIGLHLAAVLALGRGRPALSLLPLGLALFAWAALIAQGGIDCNPDCGEGDVWWTLAFACLGGMLLVVLVATVVVVDRWRRRREAGR